MTKNLSTVLKYIPLLAAIYAIYNAYGSRGFTGFLNDVKNLTNVVQNTEALKKLGLGVLVLIFGPAFIRKFLPGNAALKYIGIGATTYVGAEMIAEAVRSGAGYSGGSIVMGGNRRR